MTDLTLQGELMDKVREVARATGLQRFDGAFEEVGGIIFVVLALPDGKKVHQQIQSGWEAQLTMQLVGLRSEEQQAPPAKKEISVIVKYDPDARWSGERLEPEMLETYARTVMDAYKRQIGPAARDKDFTIITVDWEAKNISIKKVE